MAKRQGLSVKGISKRLEDAKLAKVRDTGRNGDVTYSPKAVAHTVLMTMMSGGKSTRSCEARSAGLKAQYRSWLSISSRIADNTISIALRGFEYASVRAGLVRMIKAEYRRGNLGPDLLPIPTVAIDGKNVATLHWRDLLRICEVEEGPDALEQVRAVLRRDYPFVQLHVPGKKGHLPYAVIRQHNVTLISSQAAPSIYPRPIEASTNEIGALASLIEELYYAYGKTKLFRLITTDAGNTSAATATLIRRYGWHYFSAIKKNNGEITREARRLLASLNTTLAKDEYSDPQNGTVVTYWIWTYDLNEQGYLDYPHARQLIRIRRVTWNPLTGKKSIGNRFYVTSLTSDELSPQQALTLSRAHWRIENNTHWVADSFFGEDRRRLALTRHPNGILVVAVLRLMAIAITAVLRILSRITYSGLHPTWGQALEFVFTEYFRVPLDIEAFNAV